MNHSSTVVAQLSARLQQALPGHAAHREMAPRYSPREEALSIEGKSCREAGVLALLAPFEEELAVILTVRRDDLDDHAGQVSFPGGKRESPESLDETALREAEEEIGVVASSVQLLGALTPLYVPPTNFCVHPFVGATEQSPLLRPTDREVRHVIRAPLARLLDPGSRTVETWNLHGEAVDVPFYDVDGYVVWGATAMMLAELVTVVEASIET